MKTIAIYVIIAITVIIITIIAMSVPLEKVLIFAAIFMTCTFFGGLLIRIIIMLREGKKGQKKGK